MSAIARAGSLGRLRARCAGLIAQALEQRLRQFAYERQTRFAIAVPAHVGPEYTASLDADFHPLSFGQSFDRISYAASVNGEVFKVHSPWHAALVAACPGGRDRLSGLLASLHNACRGYSADTLNSW